MALRSERRPRQLGLTGCGLALLVSCAPAWATEEPPHPASLDEAIIRSAARHGIPESLVRRVVMRESKYNPRARNHSFWGLMQISYPTAKSMGFRGTPQELLNPIINLRYAVPYLANAFVIAGKRQDAAVRLYAHGYYDAAKHRGLLGALRTADSAPLAAVPDQTQVAAAPPPPPPESGGLFGALFGPSEMPRDAATQQAVYASAAPQQPPQQQPAPEAAAQTASAAPSDQADDGVTLVADKHGALHPPKAWQRDGGTTVIARGEQSVDQVAAYAKSADATDEHASRHRHSRKITVFAALDTPPASAQAYAATADGQDPRLMQSDSQAAIAQATAGQQAAAPAPAPSEPQAAIQGQQAAAPIATAAADDTSSAKKSRKRRTARRDRHHGKPEAPATAVAAAPDPAQQQPAPGEPQPAPAQAAEAAAPQPAPTDATPQAPPPGYPGAGPDAQPQQQAVADPADATPSPKRKHRTRHARAHKTTDVAAQAPDDGRAPPPPAPAPQSQTQ